MFTNNTCQMSNCLKNFRTLSDLIFHIENEHLDFSPEKLAQLEEEKPEALPMSYVLRFGAPDHIPSPIEAEPTAQELDKNHNCKDKRSDKLSQEGHFYSLGNSKFFVLDSSHKKPYVCNMKGCAKRYKNVNGIKYHYKNHHKMLVPTAKKSIFKHNSLRSHPEKSTFAGIESVLNCGCDAFPSEYLYLYNSFSSSKSQVPLSSNASFNYYNEIGGEMVDFTMKNLSSLYEN